MSLFYVIVIVPFCWLDLFLFRNIFKALLLFTVCHSDDAIVVCSVWSGDRHWWHSRRWHAELHQGWEDYTRQTSVMLSFGRHQRLVSWSRWIHHGLFDLSLSPI